MAAILAELSTLPKNQFLPMAKVYSIGELLIDFVAENERSDLSKAQQFTKKAGGAPANVACAIAKLGGDSHFIGCVGKDPFGSFLLNTLKEAGVDITLAQRCRTFTTLAFVSLDAEGERDFVFSRGADRELKYDATIKKVFRNNLVHFGAATALLGGPLEEAYNHYLFDALTQESFISFDANYRADLWQDNEAVYIKKSLSYIEKSHLCKFSLEEILLISGQENLAEACQYIHEVGASIIAVTLGKEGTYVSTPTFAKTIPSIAVQTVDTTGAGDAFMGCLLYQIAHLDDVAPLFKDSALLETMVAKANKAGALTTTQYGAIVALPTLEALEA